MKMLRVIPRLPVKNISESCNFYKEKMGFKILHTEEEYAILVFDKVELHLFKWSTVEGLEKLIAQRCRIQVKQVNQLYEKFKNMEIIHPNGHLTKQQWGETDFTVIDLDNNAIDFFE